MTTPEEFQKIISSSFWKHIKKFSFIPIIDNIDRLEFSSKLYEKIINKNYSPQNPREYVVADKHNGTARLIPVFGLEDNCVYYFCVKTLEDCLAEGYVDCTFGGFRLGGKIKDKEQDLFNEINAIPFSVPPFSYNPLGWVKAWGEFQSKAFKISRERGLNYFILFDIANFYNTINLNLLENKIKLCADKSLIEEIDLLFYFLKYWDRKNSQYAPKTVGIPMDDFGDSSRLLANFFLQSYDRSFYDYCSQNGSKYLRYADDQIILAPDKETAEKLLYLASIELNKIGLNINSGKVISFNDRKKFEEYWAFEIFEKLNDKNDADKVSTGVQMYLSKNKENIKWTSVLKRILHCNLSKIDIYKKSQLFSQIFDPIFIASCNYKNLASLYQVLDSELDKNKYLSLLQDMSNKYIFSKFHYELLLAKNLGLPINFEEQLRKRIFELNIK